MNNKGFTLIELIATIALLSIISVISFVSITEVVRQSKISDCENVVRNIKSAAKLYASDNRYDLENNSDFEITAGDLMSGNYLSSPVVNPFTNEEIEVNDIIINVELNRDYTVKNIIIKAPEILKTCEGE